MNIKNRINKLEQQTGASGNFCRCGTPYLIRPTLEGEEKPGNVCLDCGLEVREPAANDLENCEATILLPKIDGSMAEENEY